MSPEQEEQDRLEMEAAAAILISLSIREIDGGIVKSIRAMNMPYIENSVFVLARENLKKARDIPNLWLSENLAYDIENDSEAWADSAIIEVRDQSINLISNIDATDQIDKSRQAENIFNDRHDGRVQGWSDYVVNEGVESGKAEAAATAFAAGVFFSKPTKQWLSMRDGAVRLTHSVADGQVVDMDKPFYVGGFPMMYPRDLMGPIQETANCRCHARYDIDIFKG